MKTKTILSTIIAVLCVFTKSHAQPGLEATVNYTNNSLYDWGEAVHFNPSDGNLYMCGTSGANFNDVLVASYVGTQSSNMTNTLGNQNWVATYDGGNSQPDQGMAITTWNPSGSNHHTQVFVTGGSMDAGIKNHVLTMKYNYVGTKKWGVTEALQGVSDLGDVGNAITVDGSANVYVGGTAFINGLDFLYIKYDSNGNRQWIKTWNSNGSQSESFGCMKINSAGTYLYFCGWTDSSSGAVFADIFKINTSTGNPVWHKKWQSAHATDDEAYFLDLDSKENIYVIGKTKTTSNGFDAFILKYNSAGTLKASATWNNATYNSDDVLYGADASNSPNIYVTGYTTQTPSCNPYYLTQKYDSSLTLSWTKTYTGTAGSNCPTFASTGLRVKRISNSGDIIVGGESYQIASSNNVTGITLVAYNSAGTQLWSTFATRGTCGAVPGQTWIADGFPTSSLPLDVNYDGCHTGDIVYFTCQSPETGNSCSTNDATTLFWGPAPGNCSGRMEEPKQEIGSGYPELHSVIYPNPFNSKATFKTGSETAIANSSLIIYDIMGKEIQRIDNINSTEIAIDKGNMPTGIYFFRYMCNSNQLSSGKFIIQ